MTSGRDAQFTVPVKSHLYGQYNGILTYDVAQHFWLSLRRAEWLSLFEIICQQSFAQPAAHNKSSLSDDMGKKKAIWHKTSLDH